MRTLKTVRNEFDYHIELDGCVVNIRQGLTNDEGKKLTAIEILPDDHYAGEKIWELEGSRINRVIQTDKYL